MVDSWLWADVPGDDVGDSLHWVFVVLALGHLKKSLQLCQATPWPLASGHAMRTTVEGFPSQNRVGTISDHMSSGYAGLFGSMIPGL